MQEQVKELEEIIEICLSVIKNTIEELKDIHDADNFKFQRDNLESFSKTLAVMWSLRNEILDDMSVEDYLGINEQK